MKKNTHFFDFKKEVKLITRQLIDYYQPEKIIIFGSFVKGKFSQEKSDLDFLIIKKNAPQIGRQRIYELDKLIDYKIAADFIVYTPEEIKRLIKLKDPFVISILREGKVLYEKKSSR